MNVAPNAIDGAAIEAAARALRAGELVAFPTETVYGLGADATNSDALRRLYAAKGRPTDHPVIVHFGVDNDLDEWAVNVPEVARALAARWWPGPLTLVMRATDRVSRVATGGLDTVGLRVPDHPVALALLAAFGDGVAAPSANRFGRVSPTTAAAVIAEFGADIATILDGGPSAVGVESTIIDCSGEDLRVLRPGAITVEMISEFVGLPVGIGGSTRAPGTLAVHYAPNARVEVVEPNALSERVRALGEADVTVAVITFGPTAPAIDSRHAVTLATMASVDEYAFGLYSALRKADDLGMDVVLAAAPPDRGLGRAVMDRLRRAASDR